MLPRSFGALMCTGNLHLSDNQLGSLPTDFGQLEVDGDLDLQNNWLRSLPAEFGQLKLGKACAPIKQFGAVSTG